MHYRHEWKIEINRSDLLVMRARLRAFAKPDPYTNNGRYYIRSLYFDTPGDQALKDKIEGVNRREKFRIRYYNNDTSLIHLEKKSKINELSCKQYAELTKEQAQSIVDNHIFWMADDPHPLINELYSKMRSQGLAPKTIVDYTREPYIYPAGNVRITLDYDIRTGLGGTDFLRSDCPMVPAGDAPILMEVKWDAFLPDIVRDAVTLRGRQASSFSKYAQCRIYG